MGIALANTDEGIFTDLVGVTHRTGSLAITGLTAGADNTVPHGRPFTPLRLSYRPQAAGGWNETQAPDATNIYITVAAGGPTAFTVDYRE
jgi:hypothetical protein